MGTRTQMKISVTLLLPAIFMMAGCGAGTLDGSFTDAHIAVDIVDAGLSAASIGSVNAQSINVGTIYLEQQYAPPTVGGYSLQASDVSVKGSKVYVSYSYRDPSGLVKAGAIQQMNPYTCDSILTLYTDFCLSSGSLYTFPTSNIYSTASDGTNLYAVGTTTNSSTDPYYGRLYKLNLDSAGNATSIAATATLPSYTGTGVQVQGTNVLATYGTAPSGVMTGGFGVFSKSNLASVASQTLFDARDIMVDPSNTSRAYVVTGAVSAGSQGKTIEYNSNASGSAIRTIATGGNLIAESRSTVLVGNQLIISSAGDAGFAVTCKATGNVIATKAAPILAGITATNTVTNGFAAVPGYLLVANGEAGVYIYQFNKNNLLDPDYCNGVTLTLLGRLALSTGTYVNAALSANSIKAVTTFNLLNVVTSRLLVIASGNKGISLLNVTNLTVPLLGVDDF